MASGKKPVAELFSDLVLLVDLPKRIGIGWDNLLIRLGLTKSNIDHLESDYRFLTDKIKNGLNMWNTENKHMPYRDRANKLTEALKDEDMRGLAEELEGAYNLEDPANTMPNITEEFRELSDDIHSEKTTEPSEYTGNKVQTLMTGGPGLNKDIPLRAYQSEIARDGLKGDNSIIWAGTGSGKTWVAVYIMKNHLDRLPKGRIAFFTTTVTLLDQQYKVICDFLPMYKHKIRKFSGRDQSGERLPAVVKECCVCVLTPMILANCLNSGSISLNLFSMFVFDECHHTRKNEPYNQVMAHYRKAYLKGNNAILPQIIGMTASVGTERAWNVQGAEDSILELMARMNVCKIATPRENIEEYKQFVPDPITRSEVMRDREKDPIREAIERAMNLLENWLRSEVSSFDPDVRCLLMEMPVGQRMDQQYQSWLSRLQDVLPHSKALRPSISYEASVVSKHLTMYHNALCVNNVLCMKNVVDHLKRSQQKYHIHKGEKKNAVFISRSYQDNTGVGNTGTDEISVVSTGSDETCVLSTGNDEASVVPTGRDETCLVSTEIEEIGVINIGSDETIVDKAGTDEVSVVSIGSGEKSLEKTASDNRGVVNTRSDITDGETKETDNTCAENIEKYNRNCENGGFDKKGRNKRGIEKTRSDNNVNSNLTDVDNTVGDFRNIDNTENESNTGSDNGRVGNTGSGFRDGISTECEDTENTAIKIYKGNKSNTGSDNGGVGNTGGDNGGVNNTGSEDTEITVITIYEEVIKELECLSKNQENENPNIVRLQEMVDEIFREKGEDSTFIVFVEKRESAKDVSDYLNEKSEFAKCCPLMSSRPASEDDQRQSLAQRTRAVELLKAKKYNGLVATPVAEEGLDIPSCNFVICYNKSSNEISTLQTAGRSRAIKGTVVNFSDQQKRRQEEVNVMRLKLMHQALENILAQPIDQIERKVTQRMRSLTGTETEEESIRQAQIVAKTQSNFTLRCLNCQSNAVSSCDIRCYITSQYIVIGKSFYSKIKRRKKEKIGRYDGIHTKHNIVCRHCKCDWGVGACNNKAVFFAILKIAQFIVKDDDTGQDYNRKTWTKLPFTVEPMTDQDFVTLEGVEELVEDTDDI